MSETEQFNDYLNDSRLVLVAKELAHIKRELPKIASEVEELHDHIDILVILVRKVFELTDTSEAAK